MDKWLNLGRICTVEFWDLALARALRSFLEGVAVGFVGGCTNVVALDWKTLLLSGAGMAVASLVASAIKNLPEESDE